MFSALFLQVAALSTSATGEAPSTESSAADSAIVESLDTGPKAFAATEVVVVEGATKDQLYSSALAWIGTSFTSAKATIDVADSAGGQIIAKPVIPFEPASFMGGACTGGVVTYIVSIAVKDGRYKYEIGSFSHSYRGITCDSAGCNYGLITDSEWNGPKCAGFGGDKKNWTKLQAVVQSEIQALVPSLKAAMGRSAGSDW